MVGQYEQLGVTGDVPLISSGFCSVEGATDGTLLRERAGVRHGTLAALTLPCAPTPGTETQPGGIPSG